MGLSSGVFFSLRRRLLSPTVLVCFSLLCLCSLTTADDQLTAYEILQSYDFPVGLLHTGVSGYDYDSSTGKFSVYLNETCSFTIQNSYELKYRSTIKGYITKDKITQLQGISVKVFLFWVNIIEVTRIGDQLDFSVGITSADFPVVNFDECPQCGCGFDCKKGQVRRIRTNPSVSSS
ncbi:uncharacterized protein LOC122657657 [Telopea speciosissima]|uniref:uncharacterized protein LOC122657657 n=1 Tax=Telopea speciosissima TaxID=54955 RepID=UPI001CC4EA26|nr:uncharacterized protein LOC122657657 [Telopea speciosissima]